MKCPAQAPVFQLLFAWWWHYFGRFRTIWKVEPAGRSGSLEDGPWFPFHPSLFFLTLPCYKESQQQVPGIMTRIPATISPCLPHHRGWYHLKLWAKKNLYPYNCFLSGIWSQWQIPAPEFIIDINQNSNFRLSNTKAMLTGAHWPIVHDAMRWYSDLRHDDYHQRLLLLCCDTHFMSRYSKLPRSCYVFLTLDET